MRRCRVPPPIRARPSCGDVRRDRHDRQLAAIAARFYDRPAAGVRHRRRQNRPPDGWGEWPVSLSCTVAPLSLSMRWRCRYAVVRYRPARKWLRSPPEFPLACLPRCSEYDSIMRHRCRLVMLNRRAGMARPEKKKPLIPVKESTAYRIWLRGQDKRPATSQFTLTPYENGCIAFPVAGLKRCSTECIICVFLPIAAL